ncbi:MAG TPA: hypothetical protein VIY09_00590 [Rhizomicrobium sp.]
MGVVLRFVSLVLLLLALMLLGADAIASLGKGGQITVRSIEQVWAVLGAGGAGGLKEWLAHSLPSPLPGWVGAVLTLPAWAPSGVLGVVLAFLFGRHASERV